MSSPRKPALKLAWCSHRAARFATENWHYSRCLPAGKVVKIGVWEDDVFTGCILFSRGATPEIGRPFKLNQTAICELTRVALREHDTPVSRMLRIALSMLHRANPGLRMVVSFADTTQGHLGAIYQAANWLYLGRKDLHAYRVHGQLVHPRSLGSRYGRNGQSIPWLRRYVDREAQRVNGLAKYKYVWPLDQEMRDRLAPLGRPYPKRAPEGKESSRPVTSGEEGGASPTPALSRSA